MLKLLSAPATNDRTPRYMERALAAIHQASNCGEPITFLYGTTNGRVGLFIQYGDSLDEFVAPPIAANYPNCSLAPVESIDAAPSDWETWSASLHLTPEIFPILRHAQFEDLLNGTFADPVSAILRAVQSKDDLRCHVAITVAPASERRRQRALHAIRLLDREFFRRHPRLAEYYAAHITRLFPVASWLLGLLARQSPHPNRTTIDTTGSRLHDREENVQAASGKIGGHLFQTHIRIVAQVPRGQGSAANDRIRQIVGAFGAFTQSRLAVFEASNPRRGISPRPRVQGSLLSHEELATLFHPPTASAEAEGMQTLEFRELEPPPAFRSGAEPDAATLGRVLFRTDTRLLGMDADARRRHMYVVGATGAGKSTLLLNLIQQDMRAARGLTLIDVHGDLAGDVIARVPTHRTNDAIVFDAAAEHVVPFNPLACPDPERVDHVTSGVVSAFKKLYDSWGPRLENLLRAAVFATVEKGGTFLDMLKLLTDERYRESVVPRIADEVIRAFWTQEFAGWNAAYRTEAVSSVTNKLLPFLASRQLRAITSGSKSPSLDLRRVMDEAKILVVNLSRGRLGQDNATLLGSLLLTSIEQAAISRADLPEGERRDHYLYLDEFQSLVTPSTAILLSEARKYRFSLTLSHQLTRQLDPATYHAVVGNCGTIMAFRVGLEDAELLAPALSRHPGQVTAADLCNLPNFTAYARLLIDGHPSRPFSLRTLPPEPLGPDDRGEAVRRASQRRHSRPISSTLVAA